VDSVKYTGPVVVAGDCTKVRARLAYSTDFGSHVLGSVLPLESCVVDEYKDIENIVEDITKAKAEVTHTYQGAYILHETLVALSINSSFQDSAATVPSSSRSAHTHEWER
jgi:hypothetical protein